MTDTILSLLPRGAGHQFLLYGDSCSGVPNALHERTFASVNAVVRRFRPQPEFILFPGDEVIGLVPDAEALRAQWRYWLDTEMAWLDRKKTPMWHTTGNHTAYDEMSEGVFREVLRLPENGPRGQEGLSYWVRRGDLLMVFVHTLWTGMGGEGHVETPAQLTGCRKVLNISTVSRLCLTMRACAIRCSIPRELLENGWTGRSDLQHSINGKRCLRARAALCWKATLPICRSSRFG